nr:MAG TPA: hypothetical protein [Caudoviricetes sp.]
MFVSMTITVKNYIGNLNFISSSNLPFLIPFSL